MARPGRPTSYDPQYCETVIEHMAQGFSLESFAGSIECVKDTVYEWMKVHPEFSDSVKIGRQKQAQFYEKLGLAMAMGHEKVKDGNATAFIWMTKNMLHWKDRSVQEIDAQITANQNFDTLSDERKRELLERLLKSLPERTQI